MRRHSAAASEEGIHNARPLPLSSLSTLRISTCPWKGAAQVPAHLEAVLEGRQRFAPRMSVNGDYPHGTSPARLEKVYARQLVPHMGRIKAPAEYRPASSIHYVQSSTFGGQKGGVSKHSVPTSPI